MDKDYESLRIRLEKDFSWPSVYLFKFIIPSDNKKIALVESAFPSKESKINIRQSANGKYVSISVKEVMLSPSEVIEKYQKLEGIEGLISL